MHVSHTLDLAFVFSGKFTNDWIFGLRINRDSLWSILEESKDGALVVLIKKIASKGKKGKFNEAEKGEHTSELDSRWKGGGRECKKQPDPRLSTAAVMKVAAARMNAKGMTPQRRPTHHMYQQEAEYLPGDQSCPRIALSKADRISGEASLAHQYGK